MAFTLLDSRSQFVPQTAAFAEWLSPDGARAASFYRTGGGYLVRFPDLADFEISPDALAIACHPAPSVTEATCRNLYLNQVLPLALSKRGKLVIHASAVELAPDHAAIFAGRSGSGKSTLAAAFATAGHPFLSDDGLVVEEDGDGYRAVPSHPSIRLWNDSEDAVMGAGPHAISTARAPSKTRVDAQGPIVFCREPRPLSCVYFLGEADAAVPQFERLAASQALIEWVKNSFLLDPEERPLLASHFERLTKLVVRLPCFRLHYPRRFDALGGVRQAIAEHCRSTLRT
jgi:hypothetical protein